MSSVIAAGGETPREERAAAARDYNPSMYELLKTIDDPSELRRL